MALTDEQGDLRLVASSTGRLPVEALFDPQRRAGPVFECYRSVEPVVNQRPDGADGRWPGFGPAARAAGIGTVHAVPMRRRDHVIGVLAAFHTGARELTPTEIVLAQALADIATIAIAQERSLRRALEITEQLQQALDSRIVIEQAKGVVAARLRTDMPAAFEAIRGYARAHNRRVSDVAGEIVRRRLRIDRLGPVPTDTEALGQPILAGVEAAPSKAGPSSVARRTRRSPDAEGTIPRSA